MNLILRRVLTKAPISQFRIFFYEEVNCWFAADGDESFRYDYDLSCHIVRGTV